MNNKRLIYIIVGSIFVGGILGIVPPAFISANTQNMENNTTYITYNNLKTVKMHSVVLDDSLTITERINRIEEIMSVDMNIMTQSKDTTTLCNLYSYKNATISEDGKDFIKQYESLSLKAYKLHGESHYTIGYGHVIYDGENIPHSITKQYANALFDNDIEKFNDYVRSMLDELDHRFLYTQGFIDGLVSLTYNCGPDGVKRTRFWKRMKSCRYDKKNHCINKDDLKYAIEAVKTANISKYYANGHKIRRKHEHNTMIASIK